MTRLVKATLIALGLVLLSVLLYVGYGYRNLKLQSEAAERVRAEKQPIFQAQLAQYKSALRIGTTRSEVLKYLQAHKVAYSEDGQGNILLNIGEEPDVFPCDLWGVYVSFEFAKVQPQIGPSPLDLLGAISLQGIGHCL